MPLLPSKSCSHDACIPLAKGVTVPKPVITTRLWHVITGGGSIISKQFVVELQNNTHYLIPGCRKYPRARWVARGGLRDTLQDFVVIGVRLYRRNFSLGKSSKDVPG